MDERRFDDLTRALAGATSRRGLLRGALAALGGVLATGRAVPVGAACPTDQVARPRMGCVCKTTGRPPNGAGCPCPTGQLRCGDACLDTTRDLANCGGCGIACPASTDPCRVAVCRTGACTTLPTPRGTECSDGDACTTGDACDGAGRCVGVPTLCDDGLACTENACDPTSGACLHSLLAGWCLIDDACVAAATRHPTSPCQLCDLAQATDAWSNAPLGTACDDTTLCNGEEACDNQGTCQPGIPVACQPLDQCHDAGICDPATGHCTTPAKFNGTPCDDGDACTTDTCQDGVCVGRITVECNPLRACNRLLGCDPATGQCVYDPADEGEPCGPATACADRVCRAGVCLLEPKPAGTPCDDGNACTRDETCDGLGSCRPDLIITCFSLNPCQQAGTCDPATGECHYTPAPAGTVCRPAVGLCSTPAVCDGESFACPANPAACDDGLTCTTDTCDPASGACRHDLDPTACLINGACYPAGASNPANPCLICDPARSQATWMALPDGTSCGSDCLSGQCTLGSCFGQVTPDMCAIGAACVAAGIRRPTAPCEVCDPTRSTLGWSQAADGTACETACRSGGACQAGACLGGEPAPDVCAIDAICYSAGQPNPLRPCERCDPATSQTAWTPLADGAPCGDRADLCLLNPTCQAGICRPETTVSCPQPPGLALCRQIACDPATGGCIETGVHESEDRKGCEHCSRCADGACAGTPVPIDCDTDLGSCRTCDPATSTCVLAPSGTDCGSTCDTRLTCDAAGFCSGITIPGGGCLDLGECPATVCDPDTQRCVETGANDGKVCGGHPCLECRGGRCGLKACAPCQSCDPASGQCVACEPCCKGACGQTPCGPDLCCAPGHTCVVLDDGTPTCQKTFSFPCRSRCGPNCCDAGHQCCGLMHDGRGACCPADTTCCPVLGFFVCCPGVCSNTGFGC